MFRNSRGPLSNLRFLLACSATLALLSAIRFNCWLAKLEARVAARALTRFSGASSVHTIGGVVSPAEPVMLIVPASDLLAVEAKIGPQDIDQLHIGQPVMLRLSAFNQRTTPEIQGKISRISADVTVDQRTGQNFYTARISIGQEEMARLGESKLLPGMPAEVFAKTYDRSLLSYLTKPLHDQMARAFRER